ncbi:MAG: zinc ribbon domain-containing protein [Chromatiaceae bacterium]|nr:zinc ribbon domain-containing protein [Chromatiaceae bacterium]
MSDTLEKEIICPGCGRRYAADANVCPACGGTGKAVEIIPDSASEWARTRDSLKTKWVATMIAFWVSAAILGFLLFVDGKLNLILSSIVLGMLVIGMWLKTRYQLHQRKEPSKH